MKHPELIYLFKMLENIVLICCVAYVANSLGNWKLLWFLILVPINFPQYRSKNDDDKTEEEEKK